MYNFLFLKLLAKISGWFIANNLSVGYFGDERLFVLIFYCPEFGKLCPQGTGVRLEFAPPFTLSG
jgi:hypothetical protein